MDNWWKLNGKFYVLFILFLPNSSFWYFVEVKTIFFALTDLFCKSLSLPVGTTWLLYISKHLYKQTFQELITSLAKVVIFWECWFVCPSVYEQHCSQSYWLISETLGGPWGSVGNKWTNFGGSLDLLGWVDKPKTHNSCGMPWSRCR